MRIRAKPWWKSDQFKIQYNMMDKLGANEPIILTRSMKKSLRNVWNIVKAKKCGKKQYIAYRGQMGLFSIKRNHQKGELQIPCFGTIVTESKWNRIRGTNDVNKYVLSWKPEDENGYVIEGEEGFILIPDLDENRPAWTYANDGERKNRKNASNCVFRLIKTNGMMIPHIVNTRKINVGDQILVKYGEGYWHRYGHELQ